MWELWKSWMGKRGWERAYALGDLGEVDGDLRGGDADADTVEDAAGDEGTEAISGDLDGRSD